MPAEQIAEPAGLAAVPFERKGFYRLSESDLPVTVLIPQWGLLQVTAIDLRDADAPSVIIQTKRVSSVGNADVRKPNDVPRRRAARR